MAPDRYRTTKDSTTLTPRRRDVLEAISRYKDAHNGCSPTIRELMKAVELNSTSAVFYHLEWLERMGYISRGVNSPRSIEIV